MKNVQVIHLPSGEELSLEYLASLQRLTVPEYEEYELEPKHSRAVEVAPGVHVSLLGTGDFLLPGGRVKWGALIGVWGQS